MSKDPYKKLVKSRLRKRTIDNELSSDEENWMNSFDKEMQKPLPVNLPVLTRWQLLRYLKTTIMSETERKRIIDEYNITDDELRINFNVKDCIPAGIANFDPELLEYLNIDLGNSDYSYESSNEENTQIENNNTNESETERDQNLTSTSKEIKKVESTNQCNTRNDEKPSSSYKTIEENKPTNDSDAENNPANNSYEENKPKNDSNEENKITNDSDEKNKSTNDSDEENKAINYSEVENKVTYDSDKENNTTNDSDKEHKATKNSDKENKPTNDSDEENKSTNNSDEESRPTNDSDTEKDKNSTSSHESKCEEKNTSETDTNDKKSTTSYDSNYEENKTTSESYSAQEKKNTSSESSGKGNELEENKSTSDYDNENDHKPTTSTETNEENELEEEVTTNESDTGKEKTSSSLKTENSITEKYKPPEARLQIPTLVELCRNVLGLPKSIAVNEERIQRQRTFRSLFQIEVSPKSSSSSSSNSSSEYHSVADEDITRIYYDEKKCRIRKLAREGAARKRKEERDEKEIKSLVNDLVQITENVIDICQTIPPKSNNKDLSQCKNDTSLKPTENESELIKEIQSGIMSIKSLLRKSTSKKTDSKVDSSRSSVSELFSPEKKSDDKTTSSYDESIGQSTVLSGDDNRKPKQKKRTTIFRKKIRSQREPLASSTESDLTNEDSNRAQRPSSSFCSLLRNLRKSKSSENTSKSTTSIDSDKSQMKFVYSGNLEEESSKSSNEHLSSPGNHTQYSDANSNEKIPTDNEIILSPPLSSSENTIITISSDSEEEELDEDNEEMSLLDPDTSCKSSEKEDKSAVETLKDNTSDRDKSIKSSLHSSPITIESTDIELKDITSSEMSPIISQRKSRTSAGTPIDITNSSPIIIEGTDVESKDEVLSEMMSPAISKRESRSSTGTHIDITHSSPVIIEGTDIESKNVVLPEMMSPAISKRESRSSTGTHIDITHSSPVIIEGTDIESKNVVLPEMMSPVISKRQSRILADTHITHSSPILIEDSKDVASPEMMSPIISSLESRVSSRTQLRRTQSTPVVIENVASTSNKVILPIISHESKVLEGGDIESSTVTITNSLPSISGSLEPISSLTPSEIFKDPDPIINDDNPQFSEDDMKILFGLIPKEMYETVNTLKKEDNDMQIDENVEIPIHLMPFTRYLPANEEPESFDLIVERNHQKRLVSDDELDFSNFETDEPQMTNQPSGSLNVSGRELGTKIPKNERKKFKKTQSVSIGTNEKTEEEGMVLRSGKKKPSIDEIEDELVKLFKKLTIKETLDIKSPQESYITLPSGSKKKLKAGNISKVVQRVCKTGKKKQQEKKKLKKKITQNQKLINKNANIINIQSTATTTFYNFGRDCIPTFQRNEVQPPRAPVLCGMNCGKPKSYTCTATGVPVCSLQCYRKNIELHTRAIVQQFAVDNHIHLIYLQRDDARNLHLNIAMTPRSTDNSLPSEEDRGDEQSSDSS